MPTRVLDINNPVAFSEATPVTDSRERDQRQFRIEMEAAFGPGYVPELPGEVEHLAFSPHQERAIASISLLEEILDDPVLPVSRKQAIFEYLIGSIVSDIMAVDQDRFDGLRVASGSKSMYIALTGMLHNKNTELNLPWMELAPWSELIDTDLKQAA